MRPGTSGRDSIRSKQRSTSRSRTREQGGDRDAGDIRVGVRGSPGLRRPPGAIGNGEDWNASQTSLRLAVGLQRDSVMENLPSPSRPSSLLPSMQGISACKTWVSCSGRRPSISGVANTQAAEGLRFFPSVTVDGVSYPRI